MSRPPRPRRPLLISHDFSFSGAPLALLSVAESLRDLGLAPLVASLKDGPLRDAYLARGLEVRGQVDPAEVAFVWANTIVSVPAALQFKQPRIPIVAWIHETEYFFRFLRLPVSHLGLDRLDLVLAPASFQLAQLRPYLNGVEAYQLPNLVRQEHFRLPSDLATYVVSGMWEERKGQADLLDLVTQAGVECHFTFIGTERPLALAHTARSDRFLGVVPPEEARRHIAECLATVSCSIAEAQPLTAIEAAMAGRPALLSDIPAHRELATLLPNIHLYDRASPQSFRSAWTSMQAATGDLDLAEAARSRAVSTFGRSAFERRLEAIVEGLLGDGGGRFAKLTSLS